MLNCLYELRCPDDRILSLDLADGVLGQANDAVTGTRLMTLNLHTSGTELCNRRQCGPSAGP
jgi:hypothetical protein